MKDDSEKFEILRYPVLAIAIIKVRRPDDSVFLTAEYITASVDGGSYGANIEKGEELITVLPAPLNSFKIIINDEIAGYEFGDATHPDWIKEYKENRARKKRSKK
jgi:hypothetical protein